MAGVPDELVAVVDPGGGVVGALPRSVVRRDNLWHAATAVLVRDPAGRIYVHRRSPAKDWAPSHHDAAAGGMLRYGEDPAVSARRELVEELGVAGVALRPLGLSSYADDTTKVVEHCYEATWDGPVVFPDAEVVWGTWMTLEELGGLLRDPGWPFVPDTRALLLRLARDRTGDYARLARPAARARSARRAWWGEHVVPRLLDKTLAIDEIGVLRGRACAGLSGRVLEIGFGSGLNLPHYPAAVTEVGAVEPSDVAWRLAAGRLASAPMPVRRVGLDADRVDAPDSCYDAGLVTFTLCTVPDPVRALAELRRVLRPGGRLGFVEHGLSPDASVARWQRRLSPLQRRLVAGCRLDQPTGRLLADGGFEPDWLENLYLSGPSCAMARTATYLYVGQARPA